MGQNLHRTLWVKNTFVMFIQIAQETGIFIFLVDWYLYNGCPVKVKIPVSCAICDILMPTFGPICRNRVPYS